MKNVAPANWLPANFEEVFTQISTSGKKVKTAEALSKGKFPVVDQGRTFVSGYLDDESLVVSDENPLIIFGDHTREIKWIDFAFIPGADGVKILKPNPEMNGRFLYFFLRNLSIEGKGYARHFKILKDAEYRVPPLVEQNHIAQKLDELLAQVNTLKARIDSIPALLKRFRQSTLTAAASGRLTADWRAKSHSSIESGPKLLLKLCEQKESWLKANPDHNEASRVKRRVSTAKPPIPNNNALPDTWCWARLEDTVLLVVDCHNKTAPYESNGIPLVRTSNIRDGQFIWDDLRFVNHDTYRYWSKRCVPESGDIVFTREAPMGEAAIIPKGKQICLGQRTMLIRTIESCTSAKFILTALLDPKFKERAAEMAVGTGVKHFRVGDVSELLIPLAPTAEQTEIVRRVEQLFAFTDQLETKIKTAQARVNHLTQSILAKAFRGELVPQDPKDEPASELLARIKAQRSAAPKGKRVRKNA